MPQHAPNHRFHPLQHMPLIRRLVTDHTEGSHILVLGLMMFWRKVAANLSTSAYT
jgi:hypothetical protein